MNHYASASIHNGSLIRMEALLDIMTNMIEIMWRRVCQQDMAATRHFIREILRRSQATYTTVQVAIAYLFQIQQQQNKQRLASHGIHCCSRRMFLGSLMAASKFLQDKTYRNSAWASMARLPVQEVNLAERVFLQMCQYRLYVSPEAYDQLHRQFMYQLAHVLGHHQLFMTVTPGQTRSRPFTPPSHYCSFVYHHTCSAYNTAATPTADAIFGEGMLAHQHQQTHRCGAFASRPRDKRRRDDEDPFLSCSPTAVTRASKRCKSSHQNRHLPIPSYHQLLGHI